jgi:NodT family efflux transporter outer membrane factor (OMF) lipoprotein
MIIAKKVIMTKNTLILIVCTTVLTACGYQPRKNLDTPSLNALQHYFEGTAVEDTEQQWWLSFESVQLNNLLAELDQNNLDIIAARERIAQFKALEKQQRAENWPWLSGSASQRYTKNLDSGMANNSNSLNLNASYEFDIWSQRSASNHIAALNLASQKLEHDNLLLQLRCNLTNQYFSILSLNERIDIAEQNLAASQSLFDLIQLRFEAGSASAIELRQQQNTLLNTQASLLNLNRQRQSVERGLAILLGRESIKLDLEEETIGVIALPSLRTRQSAELLTRRADIRQAELDFRVDEANLFRQKQRRWPTLNLSAGLGLNDIFDRDSDWNSSLIGSITGPIFRAGEIRQGIRSAESQLSIAQTNYRTTVLNAMQDALESLDEFKLQLALYRVRSDELANNRKLYDLASLRYESGDTDFLNLLNSQRSWFSARDTMILAQLNRLQASVEVYRSMGISPDQDLVIQ